LCSLFSRPNMQASSSWKIYTYPANPRVWKAQIAGKYVGIDIETPAFELGKDNKSKEFLHKNPLGKVPVLETPEGCVFESNAIARHVARQNGSKLYGSSTYEAALIDQWIDFSTNEIDLPAAAWLYPILDIVPENREATNKAKGDIRKALGILNEHLKTRTFLVSERVTLADIVVSMSLYRLYKMVLDPGFRKGWPHANRWFLTLVHQPEFISVIGEVHLCEKMQVAKPAAKPAAAAAAPKKQQPKQQQQPKKPKEEEDNGEEEEKKEEKKKSPLDDLPKSKLDLDTWKRTYSNEKIREVALPWLWENFDPEGYSFWYADYKYNEENTKLFMTSNLIGGWIQRLDQLRKYGFGSVLIFGDEPKLEVASVWLFRGLDIPAEMRECPDFTSYEWKKLDHKDEKDRKLIEDYFAWNGDFGGNRPAFNDQGKVFK
jgi:elongation factor 1-gamma